MEKVNNNEKNNILLNGLKGSMLSVCISLVLILIFAFIIKLTSMSDALIKPINQVIKIVSILIGTMFIVKKVKQKGLLLGAMVGLLYSILAFVVFSILNGGFSFDWHNQRGNLRSNLRELEKIATLLPYTFHHSWWFF